MLNSHSLDKWTTRLKVVQATEPEPTSPVCRCRYDPSFYPSTKTLPILFFFFQPVTFSPRLICSSQVVLAQDRTSPTAHPHHPQPCPVLLYLPPLYFPHLTSPLLSLRRARAPPAPGTPTPRALARLQIPAACARPLPIGRRRQEATCGVKGEAREASGGRKGRRRSLPGAGGEPWGGPGGEGGGGCQGGPWPQPGPSSLGAA